MRTVKILLAATAISSVMSSAFAADLGSPLPPPQMYAPMPAPLPVPQSNCCDDFVGWYLRGDIGFASASVQHLSNVLEANLTSQRQTASFGSAGIFGLGAGYKINSWLRADVTGEYRGSAILNGYETNTFGAGTAGFNKYTGNKSEWLVMANGYVDLGTWWCLTPFVGAGVGMANVTVANFTDVGQTGGGGGPSSAYGDTVSKWNVAWAVHAGVAYKVAPSMTVELAYRYLDLGDGLTGDIRPYDGPGVIYNPTTLKHITSQDLRFGVRWAIEPTPAYAPQPMLQPLMRKG